MIINEDKRNSVLMDLTMAKNAYRQGNQGNKYFRISAL